MRLIDRLVGDPVLQAHLELSGAIRAVETAADVGSMLSDCHLRYIVDRDASQQCVELMRDQPEIFDVEPSLLRLPAENCWIEFYEDRGSGSPETGVLPLRHGILAQTDATGRRGSVTSFLEQRDGRVFMVPGLIEFDLDGGTSPDFRSTYRVRNADLPELDAVLGRAAFRPAPDWSSHYQAVSAAEHRNFLQSQAGRIWYSLPYALCFSVLLNTRSVLDERTSDLDRLNRARARRGRPLLLDHVEVSLRLGSRYFVTKGPADGRRQSPRLHVVRGHPVQRAGKTFWRATHIRGEGERLAVSRTVTVRSGR